MPLIEEYVINCWQFDTYFTSMNVVSFRYLYPESFFVLRQWLFAYLNPTGCLRLIHIQITSLSQCETIVHNLNELWSGHMVLLIAIKTLLRLITVTLHGCYNVSEHYLLNSLSRLTTRTSHVVGVAGPLWEEFTFVPWTPRRVYWCALRFYAVTSVWCHNMRWWCRCSCYPMPN